MPARIPATTVLLQMNLLAFGVLLVSGPSSASEENKAENFSYPECKFTCPAGTTPLSRNLEKRPPNGCGTKDFRVPTSMLPHRDFEKCCHEVELCYYTCLANKASCDVALDACLRRVCDTKVADKDSCYSTVEMFMETADDMGCDLFLEAQGEACYCKHADEL
ncbi:hypothetical protein HPB48_020103 [Haemaphysalis longicornis]|uniref:Uncharacterized protein n=1 Tax=Haemaphysalis longicornis TaxID=44386 RepID=A0A9J6FL19_HAELO|nr:hypothetical protein HPB48_020103 [Haemaphysalis longicornis]